MPYLPLPPSQPPPIVQTLLPEENSSKSVSSIPSSLRSEDLSVQALERSVQTAPSATINSSTSAAGLGLSTSVPAGPVQASPSLTDQAVSSATETSNSKHVENSSSPPAPTQVSPTNPKSFAPVLTEQTVQSEHASHPGDTRESFASHTDWQEYSRIHQALAEMGSALVDSDLASEISLDSDPFSRPKGSVKPESALESSPSLENSDVMAINLLKHYGFEQALSPEQLTQQWQQTYPSSWIRLALIEALYQGRHKAVSVEKILAAWQRRGQPLPHFDGEFEHLISNQLLQKRLAETAQSPGKREKATTASDINPREFIKPSLPTTLPRLLAQGNPVSQAAPDRISITALQALVLAQEKRVSPTQPERGDVEEPLELYSDRQEYDDVRRVFTAVGNVLLRFRDAVLRANQLQVNLRTQLAVAQGNVSLTRGQQKLQGNRLEYNYAQNRGSFLNTRGEIYLPTARTDVSATDPTSEGIDSPIDDADQGSDIYRSEIDEDPLIEQLQDNQPPQPAQSTEDIQRLRFEAERIKFDGRGWQAQAIRITNDPFSPPELEVRADEAKLVRVAPREDTVEATRPRLVFDQGLSLPILRSKVILDRQARDPAIAQIGFDGSDRGGVFVGRSFEPLLTEQSRLTVTPQFFLQRAIEDSNFNLLDPDLYGVNVRFNSTFGPLTSLTGLVALTGLDPTQVGDNLRAGLRLRQPVGTPVGTHGLTLEYAYRDRDFNGSLGFQDIQNSLGAVLTSPTFSLGNTGLKLNYQLGTRFISAETDQVGLADPASLGRFQASASLRREFPLWQGQALPATATAGLRYTPEPVVPFLQLFSRLTGTVNAYSSGDTQHTLLGKVGLRGQFGQFSRPVLDYTGFSVSLSQAGRLGLSPFLFDRAVDLKVFSAGVFQQVYGPIRVGAEVSLNLDTGKAFETEYLLDYSRRTYGVTLRYNPSREAGSISFRLSGFNWIAGTEPFSEP